MGYIKPIVSTRGRRQRCIGGRYFKDKLLGDVTAGDIDNFISFMGDKPLSAARKKQVILARTKPLRWAFSKGKIEIDPTWGHILFSGEAEEKQIFSPTAAAAIFRADWKDERAKLANQIAAVTAVGPCFPGI
jgi:hypothetical protein